MNWDQQELETWLEQTAKKDDDVLTVQKYAQADQNKVKVSSYSMIKICTKKVGCLQDMNLKQQRLLEIRDQKKRSLDNEVTETLTTQVSLGTYNSF